MTPVLREITDELPSTLVKAALLAFCMLGYRSLLTMLGAGHLVATIGGGLIGCCLCAPSLERLSRALSKETDR